MRAVNWIILGSLILAYPAYAQPTAQAPQAAQSPAQPVQVNLREPIVRQGEGTFNGRRVAFETRIEPIVVNYTEGRPAARLVVTSYVARNVDSASRPVLFVFNGGPISASVPFHISAFGPRRVAIPDDVNADLSNLPLVDNAHAPLDVADVVIFDVANTGWSRTLPGVPPETYFSVFADGQQLTQLVREWSRLHGRAASPKYLVGTSYGSLRATEAAEQLQATDMPLEGVMLFGQALNIIEYAQRRGNIISYAVSLPTLAAVAWSHDRALRHGRSFDRFIRDAQAYGNGEYLTVLYLGDRAPLARRQAVARRLEEFTGLSAELYLERNLRITKQDYLGLLWPGYQLNSYDGRYRYPENPPADLVQIGNVYAPAFRRYLTEELRVGDIAEAYFHGNPFTGGLNGWDWGPNKSPFGDWPYVAQISRVMQQNPRFRVLVGNGYWDTQTTIGAMDYLTSQADWPRDRVRSSYYHGGHAFYGTETGLRQMMSDIRAMVTHQW